MEVGGSWWGCGSRALLHSSASPSSSDSEDCRRGFGPAAADCVAPRVFYTQEWSRYPTPPFSPTYALDFAAETPRVWSEWGEESAVVSRPKPRLLGVLGSLG